MTEADATASFAMDLGVTGAEGAKSAADALSTLQEKIHGGTEEIAGMQKALRLLKGDTVGNAASITALKDKITAQRASTAAATSDFLKLGGSFKRTKADADGIAKSFLKDIVTGELLVSAVKRVASALVGAAHDAVSFGLAAVDNRRSEALALEGLTKLRFGYNLLGAGYGQVADKASFLQGAIDQVASRVSIGREQVAGYTDQLYRMGYRAGNLRIALEGMSIAASGGGETAAAQFMAMSQSARFAGVSVQKLTDDVKARFGGIVARKMLSLDVQSKKLHENFAFLFGGVRIEKFLAGLNKVTELFSANAESGKALKEIITTIFSPFFDLTGSAGDAFANMIKGAELATLKFLIALYPARKWLKDTFGDQSVWSSLHFGTEAILAGKIAITAFTLVLAAPLVLVVALGAAVYGLGRAFLFVGQMIGSAWGALATWIGGSKEAGDQFSHGIGDGITAGAKWALDAVSNLGKSVLKKFRAVFDMHSPSKLMRREAINIPRGSAQGIDDGAPEVQRAVARARPETLDDAPAASSSPKAMLAQAARGGHTVTIAKLELHSSASDQAGMAKDFATQLLAELQIAATVMGAPANV